MRRVITRDSFRDPRVFQIAALSSLLIYGLNGLSFDVGAAQVAITLSSVLIFQFLASKYFGLPSVDYRSALISGLSLCLLLRSQSMVLVVAACAIAIWSKFLIRVNGKHLFNPTNLAIVLLLAVTDQVWTSPGQWGSEAVLAFLLVCAGGLVVFRALRNDVALAFLIFYCGSLFMRAMRLGDPLEIPLHQLENGALLIFTFFMISDPKTTPDAKLGRYIFAFAVAAVAYNIRYTYYTPNALLYSLCICSVFVPLIDKILKAEKYRWPARFEIADAAAN